MSSPVESHVPPNPSITPARPYSNRLKFSGGNVLVILDMTDEAYWLQLHDIVLRPKSSVINRLLPADLDARPDLGNLYLGETCQVPPGVKIVFTLKDTGERRAVPTLTISAPTTQDRASEAIDSGSNTPTNNGGYESVWTDESRAIVNSVGPNVSRYRDAFRNVFAAIYDQPLVMPRNLLGTLSVGQDIVDAAKVLGATSSLNGRLHPKLFEF